MSLACYGITHCAECGGSLGINEFFLCNECNKKKKNKKKILNFKRLLLDK